MPRNLKHWKIKGVPEAPESRPPEGLNARLGVRGGVARETQAAELAAVLVSVHRVRADGVRRLVHKSAVSKIHHVRAQRGVERGAEGFVTGVTAVVVPVTSPRGVDAASVGALELRGGAHAVQLVTAISTVVVTVARPASIYALGPVLALELVGSTRPGAVPLVPVITTVVVAVTHPRGLHAQVVVALHLAGGTLHLVAVYLVRQVTTVVVAVTLELPADALSVLALQLVGAGAVGGAVELVAAVSTVGLRVAGPVALHTLTRLARELVRLAHGLPSWSRFEVWVFLVFLACLGFCGGHGGCQQQNQAEFEHHLV